ncbi:dCTP deaminase [Methanofollis formosanus]|uniref:dCTP deaminase n=1 Tax=Methanofollis formosanus TaxID=299308 RepID=A0A8G1EGF7_9EURY|nr:dCTP deaminase [Methanofollis formosanus]QYZ79111.1 dCTP deaminase [Methanofollis formosanus]
MILSSAEIQSRLTAPEGAGRLVITPFSDASLQPASYDLRAGEEITLAPRTVTLVPSMEHVEIPGDLAATLRCRSSYARRGILLGGGYVDPGFRGELTLCLANMGADEVVLPAGERVVQMILHEVSDGAVCYHGRYQDSEGVVGAR